MEKENTDIEESKYKKIKLDEKKNDHLDQLYENITKGWREGQTESNQATKASGLIVKGGKKGKGPPCMSVQDIAEYFKSLSKNIAINTKEGKENNASTPKRKQNEGNLESPEKKQINKYKNIQDIGGDLTPQNRAGMGKSSEVGFRQYS